MGYGVAADDLLRSSRTSLAFDIVSFPDNVGLAITAVVEGQGEEPWKATEGGFSGFLTRALLRTDIGTVGGDETAALKSGAGICTSEKRRTLPVVERRPDVVAGTSTLASIPEPGVDTSDVIVA